MISRRDKLLSFEMKAFKLNRNIHWFRKMLKTIEDSEVKEELLIYLEALEVDSEVLYDNLRKYVASTTKSRKDVRPRTAR